MEVWMDRTLDRYLVDRGSEVDDEPDLVLDLGGFHWACGVVATRRKPDMVQDFRNWQVGKNSVCCRRRRL